MDEIEWLGEESFSDLVAFLFGMRERHFLASISG